MRILVVCFLLSLGCTHATAASFDVMREQVAALETLTAPPTVYVAEGFASDGALKPLFFEALPWKGNPTRVFAWLGVPQMRNGKVPGVVLVHGGGGTAYKEWVKRWNDRGFAALSIAVEGQTDERDPNGVRGASWKRHAWAGPARIQIYGDSAAPLAEQWMYHAIADTVLAHSLLRALPEVDRDKIGLMGISWGGVIVSTVIGIDNRFAFAIPTYGCGHLAVADNQYGRALGDNALYREIWDPIVRLSRAKLPVLWLSWPGDQHFPLDCQAASYRAAPGPRMVALIPGMNHSHPAGWNPPDSYAFAESVVRHGEPWLKQVSVEVDRTDAKVTFMSSRPLDRAVLISTTDDGFTGRRKWSEAPATLVREKETLVARVTLPAGTRAWFINVRSGELTGSSDFQPIDR
jgi:dienelactone hydrolase